MSERTLSPRHKKMIQLIVFGKKSQRAAAILAGYSARSADVTACRILKNDSVRECLKEMLEAEGLSDSDLIKAHKDLLSATKVISMPVGNTGTQTVPDWTARGNGLNMAYKLKGLYQDTNANLAVESHEQRMARLRNQVSGKE